MSPPLKNTSLASYIEKMPSKHFPVDKDGEQGVSTQGQATWETMAGWGTGYTLGCVEATTHEAFLLDDKSRTTSVFLFLFLKKVLLAELGVSCST